MEVGDVSLNKSLTESKKDMKFAIFIFGLVAIANALPQGSWTLKDVKSVVEDVITKADNDLDVIVNIVKDLTSETTSKADGIISVAKETIGSTIAAFENTISGKEAAAMPPCVQQNLPDLDNLKDSFEKDVATCSGDLVVNINTFEKQVLEDVVDLKSSISQMISIVEDCASNISEAVLCAATKVNSIESLVSQTLSSAKAAVAAARQQTVATVGKIENCAQQFAKEASDKINKLTTSVHQCLKE